MITAIHIENFKGIGDRVKIDLKPITLLFGPNSAGKSTVVQALLYAYEVLVRRNPDAKRTELGGETVDLGGFRSLIHNRDLAREVCIRIDCTEWVPEGLFELIPGEEPVPLSMFSGVLADYVQRYTTVGLPVFSDVAGAAYEPYCMLETARECWVEFRVKWDPKASRPVVTLYETGIDGEVVARITAGARGERPRLSYLNVDHPCLLETEAVFCSPDGMEKPLYSVDSAGEQVRGEVAERKFSVMRRLMEVCIRKEILDALPNPDICVLGSSVLPTWGEVLVTEDVSKGLGMDPTTSEAQAYQAFHTLLSMLVVAPGDRIVDEMLGSRYVGSARTVPPRDYEPSPKPAPGRWADGLGAWDSLAADDELVARVNKWMVGKGGFDTGYDIHVKKYKEFSLDDPDLRRVLESGADTISDWIEGLPTRSVVLLRKRPDLLEHHPSDLGVGLAKMIPVIVSGLHPAPGVVVIEEPEANVHPRWQVVLGDLFISQAAHGPQVFLIETHSEHLVLRLLRRIRETTEGEVPDGLALKPDHVAILYVENVDGQVVIHRLRVDDEGEFIDHWPHGFFEERAEELF